MSDILSHPWFGKISLKKLSEKKIIPPYQIEELKINVDGDEIKEGEGFFQKLIEDNLSSELGQEKWTTMFKNFNFERKNKVG